MIAAHDSLLDLRPAEITTIIMSPDVDSLTKTQAVIAGGIRALEIGAATAKTGIKSVAGWARGLLSNDLSSSALREASEAAFKAADNVGDFTVSNKHLQSAGGKWNKFTTDSTSEVNALIREGLQSPNAQFLPNNQANSYKVISDLA